ncbi:MAG: iron ABC transporter permease [Spirochaetales bacterium]|jgi:iron complex transport system permease protein|nr:iron ABC transporter permease [Spirochaetales bacterium]
MPADKSPGRIKLFFFLLALLVCLSLSVSIFFGAADLKPGGILNFFLRTRKGTALEAAQTLILLRVRLPRILLSALAGAALGLAGTVFQGVFRNPLAEPYLLGVSSGAALGAAAAFSLPALAAGAGGFWETSVLARVGHISFLGLWAFAGAALAGFLVFLAAGKGDNFSSLLLGGLAMAYLFQGFLSLFLLQNRGGRERILYWMMGSFSAASWDKILWAGILLGLTGTFIFSRARILNLLSLGSEEAYSLGIRPGREGRLLLGAASLLTAGVVSVSGIIGFVGLLVPPLGRFWTGPDHKKLLGASALLGAELLIIADTLGRCLWAPREIPVGVITAFLGAPFFLILLRQRTVRRWN